MRRANPTSYSRWVSGLTLNRNLPFPPDYSPVPQCVRPSFDRSLFFIANFDQADSPVLHSSAKSTKVRAT